MLLLALSLFWLALASAFFYIAGTLDLPFAWAVFALVYPISFFGTTRLDRDLISERLHPKGKDLDPWGRAIISILFLIHYVLAALDLGRWHLGPEMPELLQVLSLPLLCAGWMGVYWAMHANKFFSSAIRLQEDRAQHLVSSGPYKLIRHPGYAFAALAFLSQPIAFGSWLSLLPQLIIVAYMLRRTYMEESLLKGGLAGYSDYVLKVRFRWIPGIW